MLLAWLTLMWSLLQVSEADISEVTVEGFSIRLVGGSVGEGRVEVRGNATEEWGTVCHDLWDNIDATVVCRMFDYKYGTVKYSFPRGVGPIYMNNVECRGNETSLVNCTFPGWGINHWHCSHYNDAGVTCFNEDVKLAGGSRTNSAHTGRVQLYFRNRWASVCGTMFDENEARVACRELGFGYGKALSPGAFGDLRLFDNTALVGFNCTGSEASLANCGFNVLDSCHGRYHSLSYASVVCSNTNMSNRFSVSIDDNFPSKVTVNMYGINGTVCSDGWGDEEANVVCKQTGFRSGIALGSSTSYYSTTVPHLLSDFNCTGNENDLQNCSRSKVMPSSCSSKRSEVKIVCFNTDNAIQMKLTGGISDSQGIVNIKINGQWGTICDSSFSTSAARVVCRQLDYFDGTAEPVSLYVNGTRRVYLDSPRCTGSESKIWYCPSSGFNVTTPYCLRHNLAATVSCTRYVKLVGGSRTNSTYTGRVQFYFRDRWASVCSTMFDDNEARVACREIGYGYGKALYPGAVGFFSSTDNNTLGGFNCTGSEASLANCSFTSVLYNCHGGYQSLSYASVACSNTNMSNRFRVSIGDNFPSKITINMYGINGTVCSNGWGDEEANVVCKQTGYISGIALAPSTYYSFSTYPRLLSGFNCTGKENDLQSCSYSTVIPSSCSSERYGVSVVCFNTDNDIQMKLTGGISDSQGIVNIKINGQWGTICDSSFSNSAAKVVCRQLGYFDGTAQPGSLYGNGTGLAYLRRPRCTGSESKIWYCPSSGFNVTTRSCLNQNRDDARVSCTRYVRLQPDPQFGSIHLYDSSTGRYGLVCADNFTNVDATVTCNELGYEYGISICCSAFVPHDYVVIVRSKIACTGREPSLINCSYERSLRYCPTRHYASVACSNTLPGKAYELQIGSSSTNHGRVHVTYMGIQGFICSVGFDDNDATVICKMKGFPNGFAYVDIKDQFRVSQSMRWLSNIQCTGTESSLESCAGVVWGDLQNSSWFSNAAVYCYQNTGFQVRLKGTTKGSGRVEVAVDGVWGKLCYKLYSYSSRNKIADMVCREKGFEGGISTPITRNQGTGPVYITDVDCVGTKNSLKECAITWGTTSTCYHINVKCHGPVRVLGAEGRPGYGRVEMKQGNSWIPVCDDQFTDGAARVVCKELGYADGKMQCCNAVSLSSYGRTKPSITITNCTGTESSLTACQYTTGVCDSGNYVTVYCSVTPIKTGNTIVKIEDPLSNSVVNASKYGFYGPICNVGWTDAEANVTCRQTGKLGGVAVYARTYSSQPMVLGGYNCTGTEISLDDCSSKGFGEDKGCSASYTYRRPVAGVLCYNNGDLPTTSDLQGIDIQLVNGTPRAGRVRLLYETTWGRVCQTSYSSSSANVACRQLGFRGGTIDPTYSTEIQYSQLGKVWMAEVGCSRTVSSLFKCSFSWDPIRNSYRGAKCYDLGISCYNEIRLTGGNELSTGTVEIYWNNYWGYACNHNWSPTNTRVACKELGFEDGVMACCGVFRTGQTAIMENVRCTGSESRLRDCPHDIPHSRHCYKNNVGLVCYNGSKPSTYAWSLGGGNTYTGEVIVNYLGINGSICSDGWDDNDARVACRELGYRNGIAYKHIRYYSSNGPYWISKMACTGAETNLTGCPTTTVLGEVKTCVNRHVAGILCTDISGIYYRITGGPQDNIGRAEVSVNGLWGSICGYYFNDREANVFCRSLGYSDGEERRNFNLYPNPPGPIYSASFQCTGDESQLVDCPHRGWKKASGNTNSYCANHQYDAGIVCYEDVRLASGFVRSEKEGPIQFYANDTWNLVCDTGFTDLSAKRVCRDIGFSDGRALCCSAYGYRHFLNNGGLNLSNMSMVCSGAESSSMDCLQPTVCESQSYASAICFNSTDNINESYQYHFDAQTKSFGMIVVNHYGSQGWICSTFWDDTNAKVFCKNRGFKDGIAYQSTYLRFSRLGPYWTSAVNCTGTESSLVNCSFNDRLNLDNCSMAYAAEAACFNYTTGIQYRLVNGTSKQNGRVEISVGGVWGTVCDYNWDDREAGVLCRHLGFSDGYAMYDAHYGQGSGPIWLSRLQCKGTETELHKCPHAGFSSEVIDSNSYGYGPCKRHRDDASVYCVDKVRLHLGLNAGAVEVYYGNQWVAVCDDGFDQFAAQVVCRSLDFSDGVKIAGSSFGRSRPIGVVNVTCSPTQEIFSQCEQTYVGTCISGRYASVICSQAQIVDNGFKLGLEADTAWNISGYLKVQLNGVWGGVCSAGFDDKAATVACKQLGFKGGVPYNPSLYIGNRNPIILMADVNCTGSETSLDTCIHSTTSTSNNWCGYYSPKAGVLCYNTINGIQYRLAGDNDTSRGRLEMSYDGQWGAVCNYTIDPNISKVICKEMGFADGIMVSSAKYRINSNEPYWFKYIRCRGNETAITMCWNYGFNNSGYLKENTCRNNIGPVAIQCYSSSIKLTKVRLVGGNQNSGRVEVYLEGPNRWGTVCDNSWSNDDASVVCRQLGFAKGTAVLRAETFGYGTGPIWLDDVGCIGTEMNIRDCTNSGFSVNNCQHNQDAGVVCYSSKVPRPSGETTIIGGPSGDQLTGSSTPDKTVAIVVPISLVLVVAGVVVGFLYYRYTHRSTHRSSDLSEELVTAQRAGVTLGRNVAIFSKISPNPSTNDA